MLKLPYGKSYFEGVISGNYLLIDRTAYIRKMEASDNTSLFFLRPRRFGKSLWISTLQHYYGCEHKADFGRLFGHLDIGKDPTPEANAHLVIVFDFSGIDTKNLESAFRGFWLSVRSSVRQMMSTYPQFFDKNDRAAIEKGQAAHEVMEHLFDILKEKANLPKLCILIDEYDHFTNEIIAFNFDDFKVIVSENGFVRKFFEVVKEATRNGDVARFFATGVTPVTLDGLTSGFNIATNYSVDLNLHDMMGFTHQETADILQGVGVPADALPRVMSDIAAWYDGYRFHPNAPERLFNPDMVLYFAMNYKMYQKYPDVLLDTNISSDYGKIKRMFKVGSEVSNLDILEQILRDGSVTAELTREFSFDKEWEKKDFVSMIFYLGLLTIKSQDLHKCVFKIPNFVIEKLYFDYFKTIFFERAKLTDSALKVDDQVIPLVLDNNIAPLIALAETILRNLSARDYRQYNEKVLKMVFHTLLFPLNVFTVKSEYEIAGGFLDLLLLHRPPLTPHHQFAIELKYLKKNEADKPWKKNETMTLYEKTVEDGRIQLDRYLREPELQRLDQLHGYLLVFVGPKARLVEQRVG